MNKVYSLIEYGGKIPVPFVSKARSTVGVFRSFAKRFSSLLKDNTLYILYRGDYSGVVASMCKIGSSFWNGKSFVSVAYKGIDNTWEYPPFERDGGTYREVVLKEMSDEL